MKDAIWAGSADLVDGFLEQRYQIGRPSGGTDGASLTKNVQALAHPAQRLHDLDWVWILVESKTCEGKRHHQGHLEIQRERRSDGTIQRVTVGRS